VIEAISPLAARTVHQLPSQTTQSATQSPAPTGFTEMMAQLASSAIARIEQAETVSIAKMSGADIPLREVVDKVMAAQQALNTTLAIRDKIVQAYIEISHTQI